MNAAMERPQSNVPCWLVFMVERLAERMNETDFLSSLYVISWYLIIATPLGNLIISGDLFSSPGMF